MAKLQIEMKALTGTTNRVSIWKTVCRDVKRNKYIYLMSLPVILFYLIFNYGPMYGLQIAFKDFSVGLGIWGSHWIGFHHFKEFFNSYYFWRLIRNTLLINLYELIFGFPAPIILALLLNEIRSKMFKRTIQTISYLPHFISIVVIVGMLVDFLARDGLINQILHAFGIESLAFMSEPQWFRTIYVSSGIWQGIGWGSIIYLAAISTIDPTLYEAAKVDGADRLKQAVHITIPGIMPTIIILLILKMGSMMSLGSDKILLMYNSLTYDTADVISTFVYRKGILESNYGYTTAVGLFNSVISFILLIVSNSISKRVSETKLW